MTRFEVVHYDKAKSVLTGLINVYIVQNVDFWSDFWNFPLMNGFRYATVKFNVHYLFLWCAAKLEVAYSDPSKAFKAFMVREIFKKCFYHFRTSQRTSLAEQRFEPRHPVTLSTMPNWVSNGGYSLFIWYYNRYNHVSSHFLKLFIRDSVAFHYRRTITA